MNRLQLELQRLYAAPAMREVRTDADGPGAAEADLTATDLIDAQGRVRAMVLGLTQPADWTALSTVWRGVQTDLALPAPAIAVCGAEGYQLWFSLATPVPAVQARAFLDALRLFYWGDIHVGRVTLWPRPAATSSAPVQHAHPVPAPLAIDSTWSAFVAPDLAAIFAETPWLDLPPNPEGQAKLLAGLSSLSMAEFQQASQRLQPVTGPAAVPPEPTPVPGADAAPADRAPALIAAGPGNDPRQFLLDVMSDANVALALRIEAAKALLPGHDQRGCE